MNEIFAGKFWIGGAGKGISPRKLMVSNFFLVSVGVPVLIISWIGVSPLTYQMIKVLVQTDGDNAACQTRNDHMVI